MNELEYLHMDDLKADLASAIEQYGARSVLMQFKESYPSHYNELQAQVTRAQDTRKIPVLLIKKPDL